MRPSPPRAHSAPDLRLRRHVGVLIALVAGVLLASAAPASAAAWSGPTDVPDGPLGETPAIAARSGATSATAADGTTWVAWVQTASFVSGPTDRVRVARRDADGAWRPPVDVIVVPRAAGHTSTKLQWPALEIGPSGRPVVLWGQAKPGAANSDNVFDAYASTLDASGAWSTPHPLGDAAFGTGFDGSFVVHRLRSGAVAAAWRSSATGVRAAVLGADGSWSAASELTGTALAAQRDVDIASDATGRITVIWSDAGGVTARTRNESGSWTPAQVVDSTTTSGSAPRIAADADGFLVSSWSPAAGTIRTAHRTGSQSSWTLDDLAAPGQTKQLAPDVAFDDHGRALLAWGETTFAADGTTEDGGRIRTRTLDPDRDWDAPETVAALGGFHRPSAPRVLTAANGGATVVWTDAVSGQSPRFAKLSAASRDAGDSSWGPPTELTSDTNGYLYVRTGVRADPLGNVVLALTPMMSAVQPNVTPVQVRDLQVVPSTATRWSARWLPGSLNLRTFMNYISSDPGGGALPSAGADRPESRDRYGFRLTTTDAWRDGVTGETVLDHHGTLQLAMPSHFIDIRIVDPTIRIAADGASARVISDGQGSGEMNMGATEQQVEPFDDAHLLNLDLAGSGPRLSANGATRTWIAARARIASGLASRYLSYGEGSTYGDLTFSVPVDLETRLPDPVDPPVPPAPPTPPTPPAPPAPPTPPFFPGPPGIPTPTPPGKVTKPTTAKLTGKLRGSKKAKRRVKITVSKRLGSKRTTYRVKLTKGRRTVATGTLRNRTLKLTVRKTVKKGKKAKYARLRGSYKLKAQPAKKSKKGQKAKRTKAPKLETTTLTIR